MKSKRIILLGAILLGSSMLLGSTKPNTKIYDVYSYCGGNYSANLIGSWETYGPINRSAGFCSFTDTKGKQVILSGSIIIEQR